MCIFGKLCLKNLLVPKEVAVCWVGSRGWCLGGGCGSVLPCDLLAKNMNSDILPCTLGPLAPGLSVFRQLQNAKKIIKLGEEKCTLRISITSLLPSENRNVIHKQTLTLFIALIYKELL